MFPRLNSFPYILLSNRSVNITMILQICSATLYRARGAVLRTADCLLCELDQGSRDIFQCWRLWRKIRVASHDFAKLYSHPVVCNKVSFKGTPVAPHSIRRLCLTTDWQHWRLMKCQKARFAHHLWLHCFFVCSRLSTVKRAQRNQMSCPLIRL